MQALLAHGSTTSRLSLIFRVYDASHDGLLGREELRSLLNAFANLSMTVVGGYVEAFGNLCGQIRSPEGETNEMKEYRIKLTETARHQLNVVTV